MSVTSSHFPVLSPLSSSVMTGGLAIGVVLARLGEGGLLGGELRDDLIDLVGSGSPVVTAKTAPEISRKVATKRMGTSCPLV